MTHIRIIDAVVKDASRYHAAEAYIKSGLRADTQISFAHLAKGYPSIECDFHAAYNKPEIISAAIQAERDGCDGAFINCFDDPGVYECRELLRMPVFGGYIPAVLSALSAAERVGVITTDREGILSEERKARMFGQAERICAIAPVELGVLSLQRDPQTLAEKVAAVCVQMHRDHRVGAVCLGCTAMYCMIDILRDRLRALNCPIVVIEPLKNGVRYLEHFLSMGYTNALHVINDAGLLK